MLRFVSLCFGTMVRLLRARRSLLIENLALRQQLAAIKRRHPRSQLGGLDKLFWVVILQFWSQWKKALIVVTPETVPFFDARTAGSPYLAQLSIPNPPIPRLWVCAATDEPHPRTRTEAEYWHSVLSLCVFEGRDRPAARRCTRLSGEAEMHDRLLHTFGRYSFSLWNRLAGHGSPVAQRLQH
jgi:hypothetical protein